MELASRWRGVALVAVGLFTGSILGLPVVQSATSLVTIQRSGSTHQAKVNGAGELMCVPKTLSTSCDQAILVDQAADASLPSYAVVLKRVRFG